METAVIPAQKKYKYWKPEDKLALLQQWQQGTPVEELCRRHGLRAARVYSWKRAMERGLKDQGELIPKSHVAGLQKKIDELERALGRKALEVDVLKKAFELKGLRLPEGI
jgi:transposase-like protein